MGVQRDAGPQFAAPAQQFSVMPDVHAAEVNTPEFAGRSKVFAEQIDHHAKEEEKTMFKMARELFTAEERAEMDVQYEEWKKSPATMALLAGAAAKTGAEAIVSRFKH